jgi:hypothetical protein
MTSIYLVAIANIPAEAVGKSKRSTALQSAIDQMRDLISDRDAA